MRRRDFIIVVGGAVGWPLATRAQQPDKLPTIAFVGADESSWTPRTSAFVPRLRELGWVEGRSVKIQYYWTHGRQERVVELAAEIPRMVDVIVTYGQAAIALKKTTTVTPIVFAIANDPIGSGLVASLSRPGGNITGMSLEVTEIAGKRFSTLA
jgi:putative tryptophan/tyrosine transport system substrate-binding protein